MTVIKLHHKHENIQKN